MYITCQRLQRSTFTCTLYCLPLRYNRLQASAVRGQIAHGKCITAMSLISANAPNSKRVCANVTCTDCSLSLRCSSRNHQQDEVHHRCPAAGRVPVSFLWWVHTCVVCIRRDVRLVPKLSSALFVRRSWCCQMRHLSFGYGIFYCIYTFSAFL